MHLFTLVLGIWLLPKVDTLTCYECVPGLSGSCTETTKQCPTGDYQCGAIRVLTYAGISQISDYQAKKCTLAQECITGSVNYGVVKTMLTSKCCNSDRCNSQPVPDASQSTPNGKKCFTCEGETCTKTVNCEGTEDHCIKTTVAVGGNKLTVKGCVSKTICTAASNPQLAAYVGAEVSCCQGNLCNSASSASAGLLLLVGPLISLVLFF
ncbi:urokinase plasminogen activator surface receptor-like [Melanotaenia boesemani]|uniref:urokinase plasminogen activator surface receptor-like n=1 Tax=Melanotaenia boesemani TaxID=1250792 RepID=UPI001C047EF8|nr:urokinase plasminogen activator surface receptor-like [Melanotaenia boesemani]